MRPKTAAILLGTVLSSAGFSKVGHSFCRTTTCSPPDPCSFDADHCNTSGFPLHWPGLCVGFDLQKDASVRVPLDLASQVAEAAFASWRDVDCPAGGRPSFDVLEGPPVVCDKTQYNKDGDASHGQGNANIIVFRDNAWPHPDALDGTLALTTVTFNTENGEIYDADMEINGETDLSTATPPPAGTFDLQSIITHEAGHFLGLAHSSHREATMFANYQGISFRNLSGDDVDGICTVYPADRSAPACDATPRHGFATLCAVPPVAESGCQCHASAPAGAARSTPAMVAALLGGLMWRMRRFRKKFETSSPREGVLKAS